MVMETGFKKNLISLRRRRFALDVIKLGGGTALGQGIFLIASPVITRIFSPEEMGLFGLFLNFVLFAAVGATFRYELAIVSAQEDSEADHLLAASMIFALPTSLLGGAMMMAMIHWDLLSYGTLHLWESAGMEVLVVFLTGAFMALRYWMVKRQEFSCVGKALVAQGAGRTIVSIALGVMQLGWLGLALGEAAGRVMGAISMFVRAWPSIRGAIWPIDYDYYFSLLKRNWKYPIVVLPSSLVEAAAVMLPLPMVSSVFGAVAAGEFFLVQRLMSLPAGLVSVSIADVFHSHAVENYSKTPAQARRVLLMTVKRLSMISFMIYFPIAIVSPFLFGLLFGEAWAEAGVLVAILSPLSLISLVVSPVSRLLFVVNRPELKIVVDVMRIAIPFLSFQVMYGFGYGFYLCVGAFSLFGVLSFLLYFGLIWYASGDPIRGGGKIL